MTSSDEPDGADAERLALREAILSLLMDFYRRRVAWDPNTGEVSP